MSKRENSRIPVSVLTGFLGSGKTTLLNYLVHQPEFARTLVIINEFGETSLDHRLVAHSDESEVVPLSGGCLCCSIQGDLVKTLHDVTWRFSRSGTRQFDRVLIETTGLADPSSIIQTLMTHPRVAPKYQFDKVMTVVDLVAGEETLERYPEALKQVALADLLLLSKSDLQEESCLMAIKTRLHELNPTAKQRIVKDGVLDPSLLEENGLITAGQTPSQAFTWLSANSYSFQQNNAMSDGTDAGVRLSSNSIHRHNEGIQSYCYTFDDPIEEKRFSHWLSILMALMGSNILRVKGILNIQGQDTPWIIHGVQHTFHPPTRLSEWPDDDRRSYIVFITQSVSKDEIDATLKVLGIEGDKISRGDR